MIQSKVFWIALVYIMINMYWCPKERYLIVHNLFYWCSINTLRILFTPSGLLIYPMIMFAFIHPILSVMFLIGVIYLVMYLWKFKGLIYGFVIVTISFFFFFVFTTGILDEEIWIREYIAKGRSNYVPTICILFVMTIYICIKTDRPFQYL